MRGTRTKGLAVALATAALLTAACGQKPGVAEMYVGGPAAGTTGAGAGAAAADGLGAPAAGASAGPGAAAGPAAGSGAAAGAGGPAARGGAEGTAPGTQSVPQGGGDTTGVTDSSIKIGVHAPVTGAAAFPQQSFERGIGVYADYINRRGGIHGRKIEIVFRDDRFDPNSARTVCKEMVEQEKVFMLVGAGGSDQIDACARYANQLGVPYLSGGVHETRPGLGPLAALKTYFAASLTYEQQVPLLARLVATEFKGDKSAVIIADNDSLDNYYGLQVAAVRKVSGSNLVLARRIPKKTDVDAPAIATQICNSGAQVVVWNASPSGLINVSKSMTCRVTFVGPGNTNGLNIVATGGCPNIDGAMFYSSFPGLDRIDQMDPAFRPAYRQKNNAEPDDIGVASWGNEKMIGMMLQATGKQLSRQSFMATIARVRRFDNRVNPVTDFSRSRFGGTAMHLLEADCGARQYRTKRLSERP
jgi:branched-chain amino acid transport system substrate-binding protein